MPINKRALMIALTIAHSGLSTAVMMLQREGSAKSRTLANAIHAADTGIMDYLTSIED